MRTLHAVIVSLIALSSLGSFAVQAQAPIRPAYPPDAPILVTDEESPAERIVGAKKATLTPDEVREYVIAEAKKAGVNWRKADWIVKKESGYCTRTVGDGGISRGCFQFNLQANPEISLECAESLECSTKLAMDWILAGKINHWSVIRFCSSWFPDCPF